MSETGRGWEQNPGVDMLDGLISEAEGIEAIRKLATGKSNGTDGIIVKTAAEVITGSLTGVFKDVVSKGCYPDSCGNVTDTPIFMKGDRDSPDNHTGFPSGV